MQPGTFGSFCFLNVLYDEDWNIILMPEGPRSVVVEFSTLSLMQTDEAASLLAANYQFDPSIAVFLGDVPKARLKGVLTSYFRVLLWLGQSGTVKVASAGSELVGVVIFYPPGTYPGPILRTYFGLLKMAFALIPSLGLSRFTSLLKLVTELEKAHPQEPHYYLEISCVNPSFRGQGIVSQFVRQIIELADRDHVGIYLETSNSNNLAVWKKLGWRVTKEINILGVTYWIHWREPSALPPVSR
jgi:ribosomal protein S18 acetylase RimI-like enzyme